MKIILTDAGDQKGKFVHVETPGGLRAYAGFVFSPRRSVWKHSESDCWFLSRKGAINDLVAKRTAGKAVQS